MAYLFEPVMFTQESDWLQLLAGLAVKSMVVLSAAALAAFAFRRAAAASRHLLWGVALVSLLFLPLLTIVLPGWSLSLLPEGLATQQLRQFEATRSPVATIEQPFVPPAAPDPAVQVSRSTADPRAALNEPAVRSSLTADPPASKPVGDPLPDPASATAASYERHLLQPVATPEVSPWIQWTIVAWLVGVAAILLHLATGTVRVWRLARRAPLVGDRQWLTLAERLSRRLELRRPVALRSGAGVTMPMASGVFRPVILLPEDADQWSIERREVVLLHELAHVMRRDCLTQWIAQVVCAFYWFNPLVWVAARRLRVERERACDDQVLEAGAKASDYASHLLDLAQTLGSTPTMLMAAVAIARRSQLEGRLLAILDPQLRRRVLNRPRVAMTMAVMLCLVLPLAMLQLTTSAQTGRPRSAVAPQAARRPGTPVAVPGSPIVAAPAMPGLPLSADTPGAAVAPSPESPETPEAAIAVPGEPSPAAAPSAPVVVGVPQPAQAPQPAAAAISPQDKEAAVEAFRDALKDDDADMRQQAIFALSQLGGPRATEAIVAALRDKDPEVRQKAAWALGLRHGDGLAEALIGALRDSNAEVREQAAWGLGLKGGGRSVEALVAVLHDESAGVREKATWALGMQGNKSAVEPLIEALKDNSPEVRATAAWALGMRGDSRAIKPLNAATKDSNRDVRSKALWALGMLLMRHGEAVGAGAERGNDKENDNDNEVEVDVDNRTAGAISGGVRSGVRVGVATGIAGGIAGGISASSFGGVSPVVRGGVAGGVSTGVSGGVAGGVSTGIGGGVGGGVGSGVGVGIGSGISKGVQGGVTTTDGRIHARPRGRVKPAPKATPKQP